ncbi:Flp family type IVb pilin [Gilliamella sp. Imp1-1]|uniref:Flp family type IVb pilin n=1 Tax=Gilliamella sp. Imp1-1 TaxID=3120248 RepID=UPI00054EF63B|nr:Flp family type IVb pilin [Gilliamella apicola]OCG51012.1 hypothetical protein A9G38_07015 [Gilliamella apicola]
MKEYIMNILANTFLAKFIQNKQGITVVEYAVISAGISVIIFTIFRGQSGSLMYDVLSSMFSLIKNKLIILINQM